MCQKKIILFGGTFDPVHRGHIQVAQAAVDHTGAEQIVLIPAGRSPHKQQSPIASHTDRAAMIRLAIAGHQGFSLSDCELNRPQPSYTLDTVRYFRDQYGSAADLYWLVGADAVRDLPRWYKIDELLEEVSVSVMYRAGYPKPDFQICRPPFSPPQIEKLRQNIIPVPLVDISSTEIRDRLSKDRDVEDMLDPAILVYIKTHRLYQ